MNIKQGKRNISYFLTVLFVCFVIQQQHIKVSEQGRGGVTLNVNLSTCKR